MRRLAALALLIAACGVALLAGPLVMVLWPLAWLVQRALAAADRLRGSATPQAPDAITWAVIRAHEADLRAGRARWQ